MSWELRIDYPNAWYHLMNRALRDQNIFIGKTDYQQFIHLEQNESTTMKGQTKT
jgi:hypothetical protein